jgi:hypothetical protein
MPPLANARPALIWFTVLRSISPLATRRLGSPTWGQSPSAVSFAHNLRSVVIREFGGLPAMIAPLIAPTDTPATQSGRCRLPPWPRRPPLGSSQAPPPCSTRAFKGETVFRRGVVGQFAVWLGLDGLWKMTRRQQINTPVNARIAGMSPRSAHTASVNQLNRPKCSCVSHDAARPAGSRNTETTN